MKKDFDCNIIKSSILAVFILLSASINAQLLRDSEKYSSFLYYMQRYYVDSVDTDQMVEDAIKYQLKKMDPHSVYIPADEVKRMNEPLEGNFEGVGISFNILNDTLFVITPIPGGPSEKVGILAGDRILKVDGENIAGTGITNEDVFRLLRGEKGTIVTVSIKRRNEHELIDFTIIRDKIPLFSLDASYMVEKKVGYIKLNRFAQTTMTEFNQAASELTSQGAKHLILDLTGNAGGYLDMAIQLADQFLTENQLIVYTKGVHTSRIEQLARKGHPFEDGRIIILIDEGSASASEIVAGAVQDWDRGIIIGRRSFGKGLVQTKLRMPDNSELRLTTAKYYTPTGRLIQKPYDDGIDQYQSEVYSRFENGELSNRDSINFPDSLMFETLVLKRKVFGGGGIMPDIFVPIDTSDYSIYLRDLIRKGILNQFVLEYVDVNRDSLMGSYSDFSMFSKQFQITQELLDELVEYAQKENLERNEEQLKLSGARISLLMKAYIARDLWSTSEFYQVVNQGDEIFLKAVEVMNNWEDYGLKK